jgi:hypothetical protein
VESEASISLDEGWASAPGSRTLHTGPANAYVTKLLLQHILNRRATKAVLPSLLSQPVRSYPLRPLNEPAIFVMGDKKGQSVYPQGSQPAQPMGGMVPNLNLTPQAMIAQQNSNLEALERRNQRERGSDRSVSTGTAHKFWFKEL